MSLQSASNGNNRPSNVNGNVAYNGNNVAPYGINVAHYRNNGMSALLFIYRNYYRNLTIGALYKFTT